MKLLTLKRYIDAFGDELDIVGRFPSSKVYLGLKEI